MPVIYLEYMFQEKHIIFKHFQITCNKLSLCTLRTVLNFNWSIIAKSPQFYSYVQTKLYVFEAEWKIAILDIVDVCVIPLML